MRRHLLLAARADWRRADAPGRKSHALTSPLAFLDFFTQCTVVLLIAVQTNPAALAQRLPALPREEKCGRAAVEPGSLPGHRLALAADGTLTCDDRRVEHRELVQSLQADTDKNQPVFLTVGMADRGQGAIEAFLLLQVELSDAGVWNRVRVMTQDTLPRSVEHDTGTTR
jgi:hypothetical protein